MTDTVLVRRLLAGEEAAFDEFFAGYFPRVYRFALARLGGDADAAALGPGLLESVYRECMVIELRAEEVSVDSERRVRLEYRGQRIATDLKVDLLGLKLTGCPVGLLINFNATSLRGGLRRLVHPDLYVKKSS